MYIQPAVSMNVTKGLCNDTRKHAIAGRGNLICPSPRPRTIDN